MIGIILIKANKGNKWELCGDKKQFFLKIYSKGIMLFSQTPYFTGARGQNRTGTVLSTEGF